MDLPEGRLALRAGHSAHLGVLPKGFTEVVSPVAIHPEVSRAAIRLVAFPGGTVGSLVAVPSVAVSPVVAEAFTAAAIDN